MSTYGWVVKAEPEAVVHPQRFRTKTPKNNSTQWLPRREPLRNRCSQVVVELTSIKTQWEYKIVA